MEASGIRKGTESDDENKKSPNDDHYSRGTNKRKRGQIASSSERDNDDNDESQRKRSPHQQQENKSEEERSERRLSSLEGSGSSKNDEISGSSSSQRQRQQQSTDTSTTVPSLSNNDEPKVMIGYGLQGLPLIVPASLARQVQLSIVSQSQEEESSSITQSQLLAATNVQQIMAQQQLVQQQQRLSNFPDLTSQHQILSPMLQSLQQYQLAGRRPHLNQSQLLAASTAGNYLTGTSGGGLLNTSLQQRHKLLQQPLQALPMTGQHNNSVAAISTSLGLGLNSTNSSSRASSSLGGQLLQQHNVDTLLLSSIRNQGQHNSNEEDTNNYINNPYILYRPCDDDELSTYQCFVRQQTEFFAATQLDLESSTRGRNKAITLGQVGIRCKWCSSIPSSGRMGGSMYFPSKLEGLYQAAQNIASNHLCGNCNVIPRSLKEKLRMLKDAKSPARGGKAYWARAAKALNVCEVGDILRFGQRQGTLTAAASAVAEEEKL